MIDPAPDWPLLRSCDAVGLVSEGGQCVGAQILPRTHSVAARSIPADLVVDAMGTGSRLCSWLDNIWHIRVATEQEQITSHYATRLYRLPAGSLPDAAVLDSRPAYPYRSVIMAVEDGNYLVTIACPGGSPPNSDRFNELVSTPRPTESRHAQRQRSAGKPGECRKVGADSATTL